MQHIRRDQDKAPFVFISYAHKDAEQTGEIILMLQAAGVHLWYDKGIDPGSEWDDNIAAHIDSCGCIIALVSKNYLASDNCKDELKYARDLHKEILVVYLEECTLPSGIALRINRRQAIMKYSYEQDKDFRAALLNASVLQKYVVQAPAQPQATAQPRHKANAVPVRLAAPDMLQLGSLPIDDAVAAGVDKDSLRQRMLVYAPAEQRQHFVSQLMLNLYQSGVSCLMLSSGASQYRSLLNIVPDLQVFTPGNQNVQPFPFNPFSIDKNTRRLPLGQMITRIAHTLQLALALPSKAQTVLISAIRRCTHRYGLANHDELLWDEEKANRFSLRDVLYEYKQLVQAQYTGEEADELLDVCNDQLQEFLNQNADVLDRVHATPVSSLMDTPSLIELDAMPSVESRAMLARLVLHYIYLLCKHEKKHDAPLKLVVLIDDFSMLLDTSDEQIDHALLKSRQVALTHLLRELETAGVGVVLVTDMLQLMDQHLVQETDTKVILCDDTFPSADALKRLAGGSMPEAIPGQGLLIGRGSAAAAFIPDLLDESFSTPVDDADVAARVCYWEGKQKLLRRYEECDRCLYCKEECDPAIRDKADQLTVRTYFRMAGRIGTQTALREHLANPDLPADETAPMHIADYLRLCSCLRLRLAKEFQSRKMLTCPLDTGLLNHMSARMLTGNRLDAENIAAGVDENGHHVVHWHIAIPHRTPDGVSTTGQNCFAIRYRDQEALDQCNHHLDALITELAERTEVDVISWEGTLLRCRAYSHMYQLHTGKQAVEALTQAYNALVKRATTYRTAPDDLAPLPEKTLVIHLTPALLEKLPSEVNLKLLMNFRLPIKARIIYVLQPGDFALREYVKAIPQTNSITFGIEAPYAEARHLQESGVTGVVMQDGMPVYCRFIDE